MARTEASRVGSIVIAALFGIAVAFAFVPLLGISSAIAAPKELFAWAKSNGLLDPALFAWEALVIGGLGIALPTLAAMVALCAAYPSNRVVLLSALLSGVLAGYYLVVPAAYLEPSLLFINRRWWSFGRELSLVIVVSLVFFWQWRSRITTRWSGP